jgi:hypothetical protein
VRARESGEDVPDMSRGWDDDDWVGTPPEGRYSRDRADPGFWRRQRPPMLVAGLIGLAAIIAVLIVLLA